jgi:asparagine synthase (glutamine-hydrolysing)
MTALAGFWALESAAQLLARVERMLKAQSAYAPDPPVCRTARDFALGRRLFRTLLEDVHDRGPVEGRDGRSLLAADIRIDNRGELGEALGIEAAELAGLADSQLLMRLLERWGEEAIGRIAGDFAFAWWDGTRLVLARDFLGQRPLHFHRGAGFFAFASMPKGLHALAEIPVEADAEKMAEFLALMPEAGTGTFFRGVERVPAGHVCIVAGGSVSLRRYWNPEPEMLRLRRPEDYAEALRESFDRAVGARLRGAGGRVGAHLSGGLDSSAVAATAARLLAPDGRVIGFTSVPREGWRSRIEFGRFADEGPLAAEVARLHPNIDHVLIRGDRTSPFAGLDRNFYLYERPMLNLCNNVWANAILDSAKARGLNVMLGGQMGNMSFSYTGLEHLPELLAGGNWLKLAALAVGLRRHGTRLQSVAAHTFGPFLPAGLWTAINRWRGRRLNIADYSAIEPDKAASLIARAAERGLDPSYRPRRDPVGTRLWVMRRVDMGSYNKGALGGWGIDQRDPTADRRLVELCLAIPAGEYLRGGVSRALARRAFADRLPHKVIAETRKGYQAADWHEGLVAARGEAREQAAGLADIPGVAGTLDSRRLADLVENLPEGDWNSHHNQAHYRLALLRGLSAGHFLRRAAGSNA